MNTTTITPQTPETVAAILAAMNLVGVEEPPIAAPQGALGGCVACGHTVASHFVDGAFVGCLKGTRETVFILVPAVRAQPRRNGKSAAALVPVNGSRASEPVTPARGFVRARYFSTLHHKAKVEKAGLSPTRERVLRVIHESGHAGVIAREIKRRAKLPHGSVQQTLNWLRAHHKVEAREDVGATATLTSNP